MKLVMLLTRITWSEALIANTIKVTNERMV